MSASLAADRAAIVEALTTSVTVNGEAQPLDASPTVPAPISAWSAWPVADGSNWINHCAAESRWRVYVALPTGDALAAAQGFDAVHDELGPRLAALGRLDDTTPAVWPVTPQEQVPVVQITLQI